MKPAPNILVTRPSPYGEDLCRQLSQQSFSAQHIPLIDFVENSDISGETIYQQLLDTPVWIFVSQQAVRYTFEKLLPEQISQLKDLFSKPQHKIIAVGAATQNTLHQFGFLSLLPETPNSEGMLKLIDDLQLPVGTNFCVVRGDKGRELLQNQLQQSFVVTFLQVYRRISLPLIELPQLATPCAIVVTSNQILDLTINLLNSAKLPINHFAIISGSSRITDIAYQKGFANCYTASSMSNSDLLQASIDWRQTHST